MSTIPTPGDLFHRQAHPLIAPAPHDPATDAPFRQLWERGITGSRMYRHTKLVGLTVAAGANWATGALDVPVLSVGVLAEATQLGHGQVVVSLLALEQRGWLERDLRTRRWGVAVVKLTIPRPIMRRLIKTAVPRS
ncbi:hypothetical protein ACWEPZ_13345 [Streptomyces sp. NPDC004288]